MSEIRVTNGRCKALDISFSTALEKGEIVPASVADELLRALVALVPYAELLIESTDDQHEWDNLRAARAAIANATKGKP